MITRLARCFVVGAYLLVAPFIVSAEEHHHHHGAELVPDSFSADSLFQLESEWGSSEGERVKLSHFAGTPQIVTMFYASCTAACPVLVENVKRIERALAQAAIKKVGFLLVTFDPLRDTAKALKVYGEKRGLARDSWTLLRGSEEDTLELAVLLGMKYKPDGAGGFSHSNIITLLDAQGRVVHRKIGLQLSDTDVEAFVSALRSDGPR